ncbi:hypothetical protein KAFR_0H00390 [Kazachstania africana CBS 2517]|uniref:Uncharacterized protein n=1 Tax=Kazachstania africana (strain ATCC 22294 / BCRC 22015 / CBS 2517 / CECT 1963 / NBRC 1671 / NRRL Y-8276) TaxID=1071382 RepID=H2AYP2_KAZAF|nr:hypothetical protein KAFR_0H00390 [Kazachstania africana CBS 2517]CCF59448.1 hypothetical protein KAFR_0H00390 [Kazachstania africana CBS 2517]
MSMNCTRKFSANIASERNAKASTPRRATHTAVTNISSSPFTPFSSSDNLFQSVPRNNLLSSPPVPISPFNKSRKYNTIFNEENCSEPPVNSFLGGKLALTISCTGKAMISSPLSSSPKKLQVPTGNPISAVSLTKNLVNDKHKILNLLKKMRNTHVTNRLKKTTCDNKIEKPRIKNSSCKRRSSVTVPLSSISEVACNANAIPQVTITSSPLPPSTPRRGTSQLRTGFTPIVGLDQVLLDNSNVTSTPSFVDQSAHIFGFNGITNTPKSKSLLPTKFSTMSPLRFSGQDSSPSSPFPFKISGGDPLLISEKFSNTDSNALNILLSSPRNRLPSISHSSPIKRRNSGSVGQKLEPKTPSINNSTQIQCTPLIEQTMNGSLTYKITPKIKNANSTERNDEVPSSNEKDDARMALKKIINGY